jgi:hypothetical protein
MAHRRPALALRACVLVLLGAACLPSAAAQRNKNYAFRFAGGGADDVAKAQLTDAEGNTYIAGDFRTPTLRFAGNELSNAGGTRKTSDIFLAKIDPTGTVSWVVGWGGVADDNVGALALDPTGQTLFVGGSFKSNRLRLSAGTTIERDDWWGNEPPGANAFLVAVDARNGQPIRTTQIGEGDGDVQITALEMDAPRNRMLVGGHFSGFILSPPGGDGSVFLMNTDSNEATFDPFVLAYDLRAHEIVGGGQLGGTGNDYVTDVMADPSTGDVLVAGNFASDDFGSPDGDAPRLATPAGTSAGFVARLTPELDVMTWARTAGRGSQITAMTLDAAGDALYAEGRFTSQTLTALVPATATGDTTLVRFEASTGRPVWAASLPSPQDVAVDATRGQLFVFGGFSGTTSIGAISLRATIGRADVYVARIDAATGTPVGAQSYGKGSTTNARFVPASITVDPAIGSVVISGSYTDGGLAIPNAVLPNVEPTNSQHLLDAFLARTPMPAQTIATPKIDPAAIAAAAAAAAAAPLAQYGVRVFGGPGDEVVRAVAVDAQGAAYVVGDFSSASVTIGTRKLLNSGTKGTDMFVAKISRGGQVEWAYSWGGEDEDRAAAIALDPSGTGFYVAGNFKSTNFALDDQNTIVRGSSFASYGWDDDWGGGWDDDLWDDDWGSGWDDDWSKSPSTSGGILSNLGSKTAAVATTFSAFVARVSNAGVVEWVQVIGEEDGDDTVSALAASPDGAVYVAGAFASIFAPVGDTSFVVNSGDDGSGLSDTFWAAFDGETGEVLGSTSYSSAAADAATDIVVETTARPEDYPALLVVGTYDKDELYVGSMVLQDEGMVLPAPGTNKRAAFIVMNGGMGPENGGIAWAKGFGPDSTIARVALDGPGRAAYAVGNFPALASGGTIPTLLKLGLGTGDVLWSRVLQRPAQVAVDFLGFVYVSGCVAWLFVCLFCLCCGLGEA